MNFVPEGDKTGSGDALIGQARLMTMAFENVDLKPLWALLMDRAAANPNDANALMDLSTILQLFGKVEVSLAMQAQALAIQTLYRLPAEGGQAGQAGIRLLALMAPGDLMTNTPLDFLLPGTDVALDMLYVSPELALPPELPEHDVLFVAIGESDRTRPLLAQIEDAVRTWPRPVVNRPERTLRTSREGASSRLAEAPGVAMPASLRIARRTLEQLAGAELAIAALPDLGRFPIIARPTDSHAGRGLAKLDDPAALAGYLEGRPESEFYVSRFIDYRGPDGQFRKYRVVLIGARPFAVHMGISEHWMIHYLNAGMAESAVKRAEEERFMSRFDEDFALRHSAAFAAVNERLGLDYLVIDCAETNDGRLLIFEVDTGAVVHAMDPTELFPYKQAQTRKVFAAFREMLAAAMRRGADYPALFPLPPTGQLLLAGGDARIAPDAGASPNSSPDAQLAAFGSSTASVISGAGFAAADRLRDSIAAESAAGVPQPLIYARELERMRRELLALCEIPESAGVEIVFAPSGTDLHLIAAQLAGGAEGSPTLAVMVDPAETGSGVPEALAGRHFSTLAALGRRVAKGRAIAGSGALEVVTVSLRLNDGSLREPSALDAEFSERVTQATKTGRRVLLTLIDQSKTGLIAPSAGSVAQLAKSDRVDVLVDACQFRIAPATLAAYLAQGFMVALTGSKFLTGPSFSGALLIPSGLASILLGRPLPGALTPYSSRADWPPGCAAAASLDEVANFGLLLRWEAALAELRGFRVVPEEQVDLFLRAFARAVAARLSSDPCFEPLPVPALDRRPLIASAGWDSVQTIFPFVLYHPQTAAGKRPLSVAETAEVHRLLQDDLSASGDNGELASLRCQLGKPVNCGTRSGTSGGTRDGIGDGIGDGIPVSALRLCASARLVVEAYVSGDAATVIARAMATLDKAALIIRTKLP